MKTKTLQIKSRLLPLACLVLMVSGCVQEPDKNSPKSGGDIAPVQKISVSELLGKWEVSSVNGKVAISAQFDDENELPSLAFGPPCYETDKGHCNKSFDDSWEPSEVREGRISINGYSGCNWFGAEAYIDDGILHTKPVLATQRGCNGVMDQEAALYHILQASPQLRISGNLFVLSNEGGSQITIRRLSSLD